MKSKLIGITGASGFIGRNLAMSLLKDDKIENKRILLLSRNDPKLENLSYNYQYLDLTKIESTELPKLHTLVHLAAQVPKNVERDTLQYVNIQSLIPLIKKTNPINVIFASSLDIYPLIASKPFTESSEPKPFSEYGITKMKAEKLLQELSEDLGFNLIIIRLTITYSESDPYKRAMFYFVKQALEDQIIRVYGTGKQKRDFLYIDDAIIGFNKVINEALPGIYNLGYGSSISMTELAEKVAEIIGNELKKPVTIQYVDIEDKKTQRTVELDTTKFEKTYDFKPRISIEEGIMKIYHKLKNDFDELQK